MFDYIDCVYVVKTNREQDIIRIFADEKIANIIAVLLKCLFPSNFIDVYKVMITNHCEIVRQNDSIKLVFSAMEEENVKACNMSDMSYSNETNYN